MIPMRQEQRIFRMYCDEVYDRELAIRLHKIRILADRQAGLHRNRTKIPAMRLIEEFDRIKGELDQI